MLIICFCLFVCHVCLFFHLSLFVCFHRQCIFPFLFFKHSHRCVLSTRHKSFNVLRCAINVYLFACLSLYVPVLFILGTIFIYTASMPLCSLCPATPTALTNLFQQFIFLVYVSNLHSSVFLLPCNANRLMSCNLLSMYFYLYACLSVSLCSSYLHQYPQMFIYSASLARCSHCPATQIAVT